MHPFAPEQNPLAQLPRARSMGRLCSRVRAWGAVAAFAAGFATLGASRDADAFAVYNRTSGTVSAKLVKGGTWAEDIAPDDGEACHWKDVGCTGGKQGTKLRVQLDIGRFSCDVDMTSDGYVHIFEVERASMVDGSGRPLFPGNYPSTYYCESRNAAHTRIALAPSSLETRDGQILGHRDFKFFATGDPQFNVGDAAKQAVATKILEFLAGQVRSTDARGVVIAGDLTMNSHRGEFKKYLAAINNGRGDSRWFYDGLGNHDFYSALGRWDDTFVDNLGDVGKSVAACALNTDGVFTDLIDQNDGCSFSAGIAKEVVSRRRTTAMTNVGGGGPWGQMHYSWDWHDVHFVQLNLFPGNDPAKGASTSAKWSPHESLRFLIDDLDAYVGTSGRPVVVIHHYTPNEDNDEDYWNTVDDKDSHTAYWNALRNYNVAAILAGHIHYAPAGKWSSQWTKPTAAATRPDGRTSLPVMVAGGAYTAVESDAAYLEIDFTDEKMSVRRRRLGSDAQVGDTVDLVVKAPESYASSRVTIGDGHWGTWRQEALCPRGSLATGFWQRVEGDQKGKDDTSLNSVSLQCTQPLEDAVEVISHRGWWGDWSSPATCAAGQYIVGARMRIEPYLDTRDDSAANDVQMYCSDGAEISADKRGEWGDWTARTDCPAHTAVCGVQIRLEDMQGDGKDDSAMNGLRLSCCPIPKAIAVGSGVTGSRKFVAAGSEGALLALQTSVGSDRSRKWNLRLSPDGVSYNIVVDGGIGGRRKYLSASSDGTVVDLWSADDGSGRQRWLLQPTADDTYNFVISGGVSSTRRYLSVNSDGSVIDLWTTDDKSGRQRWRLDPM